MGSETRREDEIISDSGSRAAASTSGSGRKRSRRRDPEGTRASILGAAERIFVARGFEGTSMSDVARRAGVTKSLIHHHFGSKEELWTEVKKKRLKHYAEVQSELIRDEAGVEVLRRSIEAYFHFLEENQEYVRLATWMMLEDPRLSEAAYPELVEGGVARIRREQRAGRLRADIEPEHLLVQFISLAMYWFMARETTLSSLVAEGGKDIDARYLDSMLKIFFEGVLPR